MVFCDFYEPFGVWGVSEDEGDVVVDFFCWVASHVPFAVRASCDRRHAEICAESVDTPSYVGLTDICEGGLFPFVCGERGNPLIPDFLDFFGRHEVNVLRVFAQTGFSGFFGHG